MAAAFLSLLVPGLGQLVQGRFAAMAVWWGFYVLAFAVVYGAVIAAGRDRGSMPLVLLAFLASLGLHLWQVYDAATYDPTKPGAF